MPNPYSDDLGSPHIAGGRYRKPKHQDDDAAETYDERVERQQRIDNLWGKQEPTPRPRGKGC